MCHTKKSTTPKNVPYQKNVLYQRAIIGVLRESTHAEVVPKSDTVWSRTTTITTTYTTTSTTSTSTSSTTGFKV